MQTTDLLHFLLQLFDRIFVRIFARIFARIFIRIFLQLNWAPVVQSGLGGVPRVEVDGGGLARLHGAHDEDARVIAPFLFADLMSIDTIC